MAPGFEKSIFDVSTLNAVNKVSASVADKNIDIIYVHENRYYQRELELKYHKSGNG